MTEDYFNKVIDLQEKLFRGEITSEQYEKEMNKLDYGSIQIQPDRELEEMNSAAIESLKRQNELFSDYFKQLGMDVKKTTKSSLELKGLSDSIKSSLSSVADSVSDKLSVEKMKGVSDKIVGFGRQFVDSVPSLSKNSCSHEEVYLVTEVLPGGLESEKFRNMSSTKLIVVKCSKCGKEFVTSREKFEGRIIDSLENKTSDMKLSLRNLFNGRK